MAASLIVRDVTLGFGANVVLDAISFTVAPGQRVGVIGPNGVGKSTLLRVIGGDLTPDSGSVELSERQGSIAYVPQQRIEDPTATARAVIADRSGTRLAASAMDLAALAMADGTMESAERFSDALEHWLGVGGDDFEARLRAVAAELELSEEALDRPLGELSGGQGARVALAAVLMTKADVVLLDEPTNDLDFAGIERLERYVNEAVGALMVVSHDRAFLERTVTSVLEIDEHSRHARHFDGGWQAYQDERGTDRRHAEEHYEEYSRRKTELDQRATRQRQWSETGARNAKKRPSDHDVAQRDFRVNRTEKLASKVRISERALERLEVVEKPFEGWQLQYKIAVAERGGVVVFSLHGATAHRGEFKLGPVDLEIRFGDRIAIVGPNGSGKTTLLEVLLGRLDLDQGSATIGPSVVIGELDQGRDDLDGERTLMDSLGRSLEGDGYTRSEVRSLLAKFGLAASHVERAVKTLSPGERTRVGLARFMAKGVNTLVLDEPTNHLDLAAIEQLESALSSWNGTLLLVTHDRRLLERVAIDRAISPDGTEVAQSLR